MEKKVVVSKRFRRNVSSVYEYLLQEYSAKIAFSFLDKLQTRVDFIIQNPETGKPSQIKPEVRSTLLLPHNRVYYRFSKDKIELLCVFDMRKKNKPY